MARDINAILDADRKRRNARIAEENKVLGISESTDMRYPIDPDIDPYLFSRGIKGQPTNNMRQAKASESSWNRGLKRTRTVGTADGKGQTVKVTRNGKTEIVEASAFKAKTNNVAGIRRKRVIVVKENRTSLDRRLSLGMSSNHI